VTSPETLPGGEEVAGAGDVGGNPTGVENVVGRGTNASPSDGRVARTSGFKKAKLIQATERTGDTEGVPIDVEVANVIRHEGAVEPTLNYNWPKIV
jgi:hypothetical protein